MEKNFEPFWKRSKTNGVKSLKLFLLPDSFLRTNLEDILNSKGINDLIICGYASEFCVDTTVRRAAALGFAVSLVSDAHTTHDKDHASAVKIREHHNCTLPNISSFGPKISAIPSNTINFGG